MNRLTSFSVFIAVSLLIVILIASVYRLTRDSSREVSLPRIDGTKVLAVIYNEFADVEDYIPVVDVLREQGATVHNASYDRNPVKAWHNGITIIPDLSFTEVNVSEFEAIFILGGICWNGNLVLDPRNETLFALIKDAYEESLMLSAICASPMVLAKAYVVEGKRGTGYDEVVKQPWGDAGGIYVDSNMPKVRDGNIITGNTQGARQFSEALVLAIAEKMK